MKKNILTKREVSVLKLICEEKTNEQIGKKLKISKRTVDTHRANLLRKTKSKNTIGLFKYALKRKFYKLR